MNNKQYKRMRMLDNLMSECKDCSLYKNGRIVPYYTEDTSYLLIGEPNILFWGLMDKHGFKKEQFLILNNTNCTNPMNEESKLCKEWNYLYIAVMMPIRGMLLGSPMTQNGDVYFYRVNNINKPMFPMIKSIRPSFASYTKEGNNLLEQAILKFKLYR